MLFLSSKKFRGVCLKIVDIVVPRQGIHRCIQGKVFTDIE